MFFYPSPSTGMLKLATKYCVETMNAMELMWQYRKTGTQAKRPNF